MSILKDKIFANFGKILLRDKNFQRFFQNNIQEWIELQNGKLHGFFFFWKSTFLKGKFPWIFGKVLFKDKLPWVFRQ